MGIEGNCDFTDCFKQSSTPIYDGNNYSSERGDSPTYTPLKMVSFASGTLGTALNETDFSTTLARGEYSNDITGPFGDSQTGKFKCVSGQNLFGGNYLGIDPTQTAEGTDMWVRCFFYFPTAFCAGFGAGGDGYGSTKWIRFGYGDGANRCTLQLSGFTSSSCATGTVEFDHFSFEGYGTSTVNLPTNAVITRDTWQDIQFHIHFSTNSANGYIRIWQGTTYLGQVSNIVTLPAADDTLFDFVIGDYWNGYPYQTTDFYGDEFIISQQTPNTTDSGGRAYIPPTTKVSDFP